MVRIFGGYEEGWHAGCLYIQAETGVKGTSGHSVKAGEAELTGQTLG